jgi:hypothetical protein
LLIKAVDADSTLGAAWLELGFRVFYPTIWVWQNRIKPKHGNALLILMLFSCWGDRTAIPKILIPHSISMSNPLKIPEFFIFPQYSSIDPGS